MTTRIELSRVATVRKTERTEIVRNSIRIDGRWEREYTLFCDDAWKGSFDSQNEAEHEAAVWLAEQAQALSVYEVA